MGRRRMVTVTDRVEISTGLKAAWSVRAVCQSTSKPANARPRRSSGLGKAARPRYDLGLIKRPECDTNADARQAWINQPPEPPGRGHPLTTCMTPTGLIHLDKLRAPRGSTARTSAPPLVGERPQRTDVSQAEHRQAVAPCLSASAAGFSQHC